jgi:hypothetical protein
LAGSLSGLFADWLDKWMISSCWVSLQNTITTTATNLDDDIYATALQLFEKTWPPGKRVRLIGVGVSGLEAAAYQLGLWTDPEQEQARRLQPILDELRERFDRQAIQRGSQLFRDKPAEE